MSDSERLGKLLKAIEDCKRYLVGVVIHLNDTYLIDARPDRGIPGFPRVIATMKRLRDHVKRVTEHDRLLVVHSGDFLGPSRISMRDKGEAMVHLLNEVGLQYCVLGNHEFDHKAEHLAQRMTEARFAVVLSNLTDPTNKVRVEPLALWPGRANPVIALTGVVSASAAESFKNVEGPWPFEEPKDALSRFFTQTKQVPFHLLLTHALRAEDLEIRGIEPEYSRTYLLGGHDHDIDWIEDDDERLVMKNLSNCQTVRVLLLLAGGVSAMASLRNTYIAMKQRGLEEGKTPFDAEPRYPEDLKTLLGGVHPLDAAILERELTMIAEGQSEHDSSDSVRRVGMGYFEEGEDALPENALLRLMGQLPWHKDIWSWQLRGDDHESAEQQHDDYVNKVMGRITMVGENDVVRDFSSSTSRGLEARDECLRRRLTDFGMFVAECARRKGHADVAILNAGSFRCDSQLPSRLCVRDLRETFLYDSEEAIVVLELENQVIDALLAHGREKAGSGAFPQVADVRQDAKSVMRVAVAKYLVMDAKSIDGYDVVLGRALGISREEVLHWVTKEVKGSFSIVEAILEHAHGVGYPAQHQLTDSGNEAETFIDLVAKYVQMFDQKIGVVVEMPVKAKKGNRPKQDTQDERDKKFRSWLGSDLAIGEDAEVQRTRDAVRAFLRALPAVKECECTGESTSHVYVLLKNAAEQLESLHDRVKTHPWGMRDHADYGWLFRLAANGMPGWVRDHRLAP